MPESSILLHQLHIDPAQREGRAALPRTSWVLGAAVLIVILLTAITAAAFALRRVRVEVQTVAAIAPPTGETLNAILQATGYVTARLQATVSAQITGSIKEVFIEEGEHVRAGDVLARLEDSAQRAALAQALAQTEVTQALLGQYVAQLAQARRDLRRNEDLVGRQLISPQTVEATRTQVETLQAQVDSQLKQVKFAQAAVRAAEVQLNHTTVRAPFSGVIVAKTAQVGEIVSPTSAGGGFTRTGVGTIVDMDSLEIEVDVNESYINRVEANQPAEAILNAYPNWPISARVIAVIPTADRSKATVRVRLGIEQKDPRILPDMGVRVSFLELTSTNARTDVAVKRESAPNGVLIPRSAIVERGGESVVFALDGDIARTQAVTPGSVYGDLRLVEGIQNGTTVVRAPPADLSNGARVLVKKD